MMREILNGIIEKLVKSGADHVYSAFDAKAVAGKGSGIFTVVGISSFETTSPIYSPYMVYIPFKTELEISITAPEDYSLFRLYDYYDEKIAPAVFELSGLTCELSGMSVKFDSNIGRLVMKVLISARGITKLERSGL